MFINDQNNVKVIIISTYIRNIYVIICYNLNLIVGIFYIYF